MIYSTCENKEKVRIKIYYKMIDMIQGNFSSLPPVDFSFRKLVTCKDLEDVQKPRAVRVRKTPGVGPNNKFISGALWLNNNNMRSTREVKIIADKLLEEPKSLGWLDLSFNRIDDIDDELLRFPQLRILYLHGNKIANMAALNRLKKISTLRNLTLHGNPIDSIPQYRVYVVNMIPQISTLDFVPVVKSERKIVPPAGFVDNVKSKHPS